MSHKIKVKEILKATGAKDANEALVRLGYGDLFGAGELRLLNFSIKLTNPEEIRRIISLIESYNAFEGKPIAEMLAALMEEGTLMYVEFGRGNSPELHVFMRNPQVHREMVIEILKKFNPDELDEYGPYGIRAWWD